METNPQEGRAAAADRPQLHGIEIHAPPGAAGARGTGTAAQFRGPLRYEIETSVPHLEAGTRFTVYVRITNPYDVPVTIHSVDTVLPVEFKDIRPARRKKEGEASPSWVPRLNGINVFGVGLSLEYPQVLTSSPVGDGDDGEGPDAAATVLQPGNSRLHSFNLVTRRRVFFTPALYNLQFQVRYDMAGQPNHDTIKHQLNVRAPIPAMIYGSVSGAVVGSLLRTLDPLPTAWSQAPGILAKLFTGVLIGAVLVVAFARKRDAQPFITIEDFYGGFFIGFLAGYQGTAVLGQVVPQGVAPPR